MLNRSLSLPLIRCHSWFKKPLFGLAREQNGLDAVALAIGTVDTVAAATVTFPCPGPRDATEPGGGYALYTGPIFPDDAAATVTCTAM